MGGYGQFVSRTGQNWPGTYSEDYCDVMEQNRYHTCHNGVYTLTRTKIYNMATIDTSRRKPRLLGRSSSENQVYTRSKNVESGKGEEMKS
jgi:hypothetical protein